MEHRRASGNLREWWGLPGAHMVVACIADPVANSAWFRNNNKHPCENLIVVAQEVDLAPKPTLPPGQLRQQLQLLKEAQEENARLRSFMETHLAASDKVGLLGGALGGLLL